MRSSAKILSACLLCVASLEAGGSYWSYVPASRETTSWDAFEVRTPPSEREVTLISAGARKSRRKESPVQVVSMGLDISGGEPKATAPRESSVGVPDGAYWPDANGKISEKPAVPGANPASVRNPWEIRVRSGPARAETQFLCGGIMGGEAGTAIGILNGRVVKAGDSVGKFAVYRIVPQGVILECRGSRFVIPRGLRTTIAVAEE